MNTALDVIISAVTAFVIAGGGSLSVVAIAGTVNSKAIIGACVVGAISAAKDVRSFLKLPPIANAAELPNK